MEQVSRRELMRWGARMAAGMGLAVAMGSRVVEAVEEIARGSAAVLWLQAQTCTGCSISTLNSARPGPAELITQLIALRFHSNLSAAAGAVAVEAVNKTIEEGKFLLVVEGAIPAGMPEACVMGGEPVAEQVLRAARKAKAVVAQGTCAVYGGVPAAEGNVTGAVSVVEFLKREKVATPVISLPGCPPHPDWLVGTLVHVLKFGMPPLDAEGRPKMFYSRVIHEQCPRFADYEREHFAKRFGGDGCLFKLGCLGPDTYADCTTRLWNGGRNCCIKAGAPCVGCAGKIFAAKSGFPMYTMGAGGGGRAA